MLVDVRIAAAGGRRRRVGFYSAIRREVPIRTFNDWADPLPGFCEIDMVAHGGTSVAGSFIQTLTMTDIATGWTECLPLVARHGSLVVEAMTRAQSLFPWLLRGADFDNDSAFMNDVVVPWCRSQKIEVTRSRAYKKNDQAFVEQKNGAVVRRLVGYPFPTALQRAGKGTGMRPRSEPDFSSLPSANFPCSAPAELPSSRPHFPLAFVSSGGQERPAHRRRVSLPRIQAAS